ncbi:phytanoyl-CoA dioxygenase family protein [Jatrophihabitans lederbergiae]|uniref:Phytanoyl-CoA dioxygenase family protein n=1 Tax=Jatrophihabitans lederbergiae TaxID=3075547 RepID=A0ABU2JBU7_9ACTN|nr:phytanoyl-CoA dioxygenase family protein [Jatrophihabitans sp. DSM 44399]MDT0262457.1 phytanoyl-CoA dioxygenase family protein [Jatrophihabitans sp. DSM 44399]
MSGEVDRRSTDELVATYLADGVVHPITVFPPDDCPPLLAAVRDVLTRPGPAPAPSQEQSSGRLASVSGTQSSVPFVESRHLDSRVVFDLCTAPPVLDLARGILGDDLLLWRSTIIAKPPGGAGFRWHQDFGGVFGAHESYGLEPPLHLNVWMALTPTTRANGCLRFVPGMPQVLPGAPSGPGQRATLLTREEHIDESRAIDAPLAAGEAAVFGDRALHASWPNETDEARLGLAVRITLPQVRVRSHFPGHRNILISGRDALGVNPLAPPPA